MQKLIWKARLLPGKRAEYIKRHDEIWPEMVSALKEAGICNYTIWNHGDELIGYYECADLEKAAAYEAASDVMKKWDQSMQGIMIMEKDADTQKTLRYSKVFEME